MMHFVKKDGRRRTIECLFGENHRTVFFLLHISKANNVQTDDDVATEMVFRITRHYTTLCRQSQVPDLWVYADH
jgi:hypothetical protein